MMACYQTDNQTSDAVKSDLEGTEPPEQGARILRWQPILFRAFFATERCDNSFSGQSRNLNMLHCHIKTQHLATLMATYCARLRFHHQCSRAEQTAGPTTRCFFGVPLSDGFQPRCFDRCQRCCVEQGVGSPRSHTVLSAAIVASCGVLRMIRLHR